MFFMFPSSIFAGTLAPLTYLLKGQSLQLRAHLLYARKSFQSTVYQLYSFLFRRRQPSCLLKDQPCVPPGETYYDILGVTNEVSSSDIRVAFKTKSLQWHPDKNRQNGGKATEQFVQIKEAYEVCERVCRLVCVCRLESCM
jgi:hypothetical protein